MPAVVCMNFRILRYDSQSLLRAVEAAKSMMIGASTIKAKGKTIPPYAAKLIFGSARRAMIALSAGNSSAIKNQLNARGHQVLNIVFNVISGLLFISFLTGVECR